MMKTLHQLENHLFCLVYMERKLENKMIIVNNLPYEIKKDVPILLVFTILKNSRKRCLEDIAKKQEEIRLKKQMEALLQAAMDAAMEAELEAELEAAMEAAMEGDDDEVSDIEFSDDDEEEPEDNEDAEEYQEEQEEQEEHHGVGDQEEDEDADEDED